MINSIKNISKKWSKADFETIIDIMKQGTKSADGKNIITQLDDKTKIIFRMDVGDDAHKMVNYGYPNPVNHINIEIQAKGANGSYKTKWDFHMILDNIGSISNTFITGVWNKK